MSGHGIEDTGLQRARAAFASVAYAQFLGLELCELKSGDVTICLDVRDELKQNRGVVHGGAIASVIDTASAFAILTRIGKNETVTTTDLTIHYLRPITAGRMLARANCARRPPALCRECRTGKRWQPGRNGRHRLFESLPN